MRSHHLPYNDCNDLFIMHFQIVFCSLISANSVFVYKIHFPKTPKIKQRLITWLECLLAMWDFSFWLDFALFSVSLGTSNIAYTAFVVLCVCVSYMLSSHNFLMFSFSSSPSSVMLAFIFFISLYISMHFSCRLFPSIFLVVYVAIQYIHDVECVHESRFVPI